MWIYRRQPTNMDASRGNAGFHDRKIASTTEREHLHARSTSNDVIDQLHQIHRSSPSRVSLGMTGFFGWVAEIGGGGSASTCHGSRQDRQV